MVGGRTESSTRAVGVAVREQTAVTPQARLLSLDAFRGLTIASMMLVNNGYGPGTYGPLKHADWDGWTFTDTVFPFFLWISGLSMTFSFARRVEAGADRGTLALHALRRAALIFLLGLLLNGFPYFRLDTLRIPGVLQRIAVCYFIAAVVFLYCSKRMQAVVCAGCLLVYWALMSWAPVPGYGAGLLDKEGNFAKYVDGLFLTGHMYSATKTWDPEGIVSTIPAVSTALCGVLTGHLLRSSPSALEKLAWMFFSGNALIFLGVFWDKALPVNKSLWTSSYAVLMAGLALAVFSCFYWLVDIKGWKKWSRPLAIYGSNAIAVYVLGGAISRLMGIWGMKQPMYEAALKIASPANASLLYAMFHVVLLYLVAYGLYKKNWFLRV